VCLRPGFQLLRIVAVRQAHFTGRAGLHPTPLTSKRLGKPVLLLANIHLLAATVGAMTVPALEPVCADAIGIEADLKDANQLCKLFRKGSLSRLRAEACNPTMR
jgi:hypothetical protein